MEVATNSVVKGQLQIILQNKFCQDNFKQLSNFIIFILIW